MTRTPDRRAATFFCVTCARTGTPIVTISPRSLGGGGEHKLKLFAGWVTGYESNVDHVSVHLRRCGAGSEESIEVSAVINCPRPAFDLRQLDDPLLTSLRTGGLLVSDALETSMEIASSGALVGRDGTESHWLLRQPLPPDTRLGNHGST